VEQSPKRPSITDRAAQILATGFGVGYLPIAPGTWASPLGVLLAWGLSLIPWWSLLVLVGLMCLGAWASDREARRLGETDPGVIVIDEIVGMAVALWGLPLNWGTIIAGFILFRALDIKKPGPIRWMDQKIRGGGGIMADDLAAGIVVNLVLRAALKMFNG